MIVASGFKVWPREVEEVLYLHPAVREAAVIGVPDPYRGETIKAVISLKPGCQVSEHEIKAFARERMAAYKYPRFVEIIDELPKTTSGKIMRRLLQTATRETVPMRGAELAPVCVPAAARGARGARGARSRCRLAAPEPRFDIALHGRAPVRAAAHDDVAARRGRTVHQPGRIPRRQRGLPFGGGGAGRERAPVAGLPSGCGCASCWRRRSRTPTARRRT